MRRIRPDKFIQFARRIPPDARVPYAFEKRILARIGSVPRPDSWSLYSQVLWKAAISACAITVLAAGVAGFSTRQPGDVLAPGDFEQAVLAPIHLEEEGW